MSDGLDGAALQAGADALGVLLDSSQVDRLLRYARLILKWNRVYNLTALRDPASVLTHHVLDSLAVIPALRHDLARRQLATARLLDVGSGAGLPGVVVAIVCPEVDVTCLDAVAKKMAFVQQVVAELQLPNLRGRHARIESVSERYDVIASRAFASLRDFVVGSGQALEPGAVWLAMKGRTPVDEIEALPADVDVFHVEQLTVPGLDAERCIVWLTRRVS